jgi:hypothetical protein
MKAVIDRIEGETAVVLFEPGELRADIPLAVLPPGSREGSLLTVNFELDPQGEALRRSEIAGLLEKLKNKKYD